MRRWEPGHQPKHRGEPDRGSAILTAAMVLVTIVVFAYVIVSTILKHHW